MDQERFYDKVMTSVPGNVIHVATVLHEGWESDNYIAVVEHEGKRRLVTTNHGRICDMTTSDLLTYIRTTEESLRSLQVAREKVLPDG